MKLRRVRAHDIIPKSTPSTVAFCQASPGEPVAGLAIVARIGSPNGKNQRARPTGASSAPVGAVAHNRSITGKDQERESSESPMLNAFCRVAPSVLFSRLAILDAGVFLFAMVFSSRTSPEVHARRFFVLLAIEPPFQMQSLVSLAGAEEKPKDGMKNFVAVEPPGDDAADAILLGSP